MKLKKYLVYIMMLCALVLPACGNNEIGNNIESSQGNEDTLETESEFKVEILDAEDILLKTWDEYKDEEHFKIMGGHFTSPVIGRPAKYDLEQAADLVLIYCFPEDQVAVVDDAATLIDLYNAARFTAGAYHVSDLESIPNVVEGIKKQVSENEWLGEKPEKLCVIKVDDQYVISIYGREPLVDQFKQKLESVYKKMIEVVMEEKLF